MDNDNGMVKEKGLTDNTEYPGEYERVGTYEGYEVFVSYDREGPDREEAMALYKEAKNSVFYQCLASMGGGEGT